MFGLKSMNRTSIIGFALLAVSIRVSALEIVCPEKIETAQQLMKSNVGWDQFVRPIDEKGTEPRWSYVVGISVYSGHPREIAELKPEFGKDSYSWTFGFPATPELQIYMACIYLDTRLEFIKSLPLNVKKCTTNNEERGKLTCELFKP